MVHADHNSVAIGVAGQVNYLAAPREPAEWPHQVGVLPTRAQSFRRRAEAESLRTVPDGGDTAASGQVLTGMGGVGKTQLAADHARTAWQAGSVDVLVWVTASTRSAVVTGYAQAGVELCRATADNPEQAARAFLAWLTPKAGARPCRWLVVLDDVADPDDLRGLWPPAGPTGRTVVTTRRRDAALTGEGRRRVEVGLFTESDAVAYLASSLDAHGRREPAGQLTGLARDLGRLPLALSQAVAYLIDSGEDVAAYRALLAGRATTLADAAPDQLPDEQSLPLAAAWSLSVDRADTLRPAGLARPMLQLTALLDPNGIPESVLTAEPALAHLALHRDLTAARATGRPEPVSHQEAVRALRALHRLNLIDHVPAAPHQSVRVHQLIQRATRDPLDPDQRERLARTAADALVAAWPAVERDTGLAQSLRANSDAVTRASEDALYRPATHAVLFRAGTSLGESGQAATARAYYEQLAATTHDRLGPDHPDTLTARHGLGYWQGEAGDPAGAVAALAELLSDRIRVLGPDHPDTLTTHHNLARYQGHAGDAAGAAAAMTHLLASRSRVLGPDHADTLDGRHDLAFWTSKAGRAAEAEEAFERLVADRTRIQGPDHPHTLGARHELARCRLQASTAVDALRDFEQLVADQTRVQGPDHPHTLIARSLLAICRGQAGDTAGALDAIEQLLADRTRVQGPDHPLTLGCRRQLARWKGEAGDAAGAAETLAELLPDQFRVLGRGHPNTLTTRLGLAQWRGEAGDAAGAADVLAALLPDQIRVRGQDHPETLTTRHNLAHWQGEAGDAAGAADAFERLIADRVRVQGPSHPHTRITRDQLTWWRWRAAARPDR